MTIPGAGGQTPPRPDQAGIAQAAGMPTGVVVSPGGRPLLRVTQIIVQPGTGILQGIFTYSSNPPAAGTLIESSSVAVAGTDASGNHYVTGHATYQTSFATSLNGGFIQFYTGSLAAGWTPGATILTDGSGDLLLTSNAQISLTGTTGVSIQGGSVMPFHANLQTIGSSPAAYSQSFNDAMCTRINGLVNTLLGTNIGVFP